MDRREIQTKEIEIKNEYLFQLVEHDLNAREAWKAWIEFQSLSLKVTIYDLNEIAMKYKTTPKQMRQHKHCYLKSAKTK